MAGRRDRQDGRVTIGMDALRGLVRARLDRAGFPDAGAECDALLAAALGRTRGDVQLDALLGRAVAHDEAERILALATRRARREPLQHLVGKAPFCGVDLAVGEGVFVPRPETEGLVALAVERLRDRAGDDRPLRVADLGSGSGAIAIAIARAVPSTRVWAVESSPHAWPWLVRNARELGEGRVVAVFDAIGPRAIPAGARPLDALVSNPPYIPAANEPADPEVRRHDPAVALYGGDDGLDVVRDIARLGLEALAPGAPLLLEHDDHQGPAIRDLLTAAGYRDARTHADLAGRDRVTSAAA